MRALAPWKDLNTGQEIHTKCSCFLDDEPCLTWTEHATDQRRSWTSSLREAGWVSFHVNYRDPAAVSEWLDLLSIPAGHPEYLVLPSEPYSYPDDIWENQRGYIEEFYHQAGMKGLKEEMARRGFVATERQFYTRIKKWGLSKNIRGNDKEIMYRKLLRRKTEEGKETAITFHGRSVDLNKIHRFVRSQGLTPSRLSTAATPTYISVYTPMPASLGQPGTARFPWNRSPHKDFISRLSSRLPSPHEGPACDGLDFLSAPSIWDPDEHTLLVASQACAQLDELPFVREHTYSSSQQIGGHTWPYRAKVQPIFNNSLVIDGPPLSAAKRGMNPHAIAADEAKGRRKKRPPFRV
ncbi:hypothetical protein F4780DRAFT_596206 [Xylariomycetidae sp. FL0641]|nr:hypothetical protein F4780DRAFT_596206 [Xylariomycetidae sp. FL0641]